LWDLNNLSEGVGIGLTLTSADEFEDGAVGNGAVGNVFEVDADFSSSSSRTSFLRIVLKVSLF